MRNWFKSSPRLENPDPRNPVGLRGKDGMAMVHCNYVVSIASRKVDPRA